MDFPESLKLDIKMCVYVYVQFSGRRAITLISFSKWSLSNMVGRTSDVISSSYSSRVLIQYVWVEAQDPVFRLFYLVLDFQVILMLSQSREPLN